ncbi:hypothetical protein [Phenylobacterium aquaticum]|uniref:hypothetical protein n=1 Tax=Phenylobacterium aquaticum TaxID=1763816 RepID=UPI0026EF1753|nr:hypothetical protein [Phenylobacterium aquaticum]
MTPVRLLPLVALMGLAACGEPVAKGICTPFPNATAATASGAPAPATAASDPAAPVEDCVHRWAYSLAGAKDSADQVALATVAACSGQLSRWNQQAMAPATGASTQAEAVSLITGDPTGPIAAHHDFAASRALFYVVQARAGHCAPPPPPKPG